ncbi:EboA domain-containing protein [Streptomyces sp. NPDC000134]|uniref:EboA domain-containing protein n=1 Tax=Streptomyces sp. NPDC000134 TaxID=3364536 RepID=UPI00368136CC
MSRRALTFAYGTNGFGDHTLDETLDVVAGLGYGGVSLTLDRRHLDPFADDLDSRLTHLRRRLDTLGLEAVVETGGRYLLDPWNKHHPTFFDDGRELRVDLLRRAIDIAARLETPVVHLWSGVQPPQIDGNTAWDRLLRACETLSDEAARRDVRLGFEPEPGMFIDTLDRFDELCARLGEPPALGLTLDIGHCRCLEPQPVAECVRRAASRLVHIQIEDMRRGTHEHLEFGHGEIDFPPVLGALLETGYRGLVSVELPRHSHAAPATARRSLAFLRAAEQGAGAVDALWDLLPDGAARWTREAQHALAANPDAVTDLFPVVGRRCGREPLPGSARGPYEWTVDDAVRTLLLDAPALRTPEAPARLADLYLHGDAAERRGVLRALPVLDRSGRLGDSALPLVHDALRTNDLRLVAAALGTFPPAPGYAARHLDDHAFRQAVLKCVFTGAPLDRVTGLADRADAELLRMLRTYADERRTADRDVPPDVEDLLANHDTEQHREGAPPCASSIPTST